MLFSKKLNQNTIMKHNSKENLCRRFRVFHETSLGIATTLPGIEPWYNRALNYGRDFPSFVLSLFEPGVSAYNSVAYLLGMGTLWITTSHCESSRRRIHQLFLLHQFQDHIVGNESPNWYFTLKFLTKVTPTWLKWCDSKLILFR
jgi:hypothetical protein